MEGRIGDRDKLKFVLDTGATFSAIDCKLAEKLNVEHRAGKILNVDKTIAAEWAEVPRLEFGPIQVSNISMMVADLRYFQTYATHIDAVIGLDLLRLSSFSIDYHSHKVSFGPVDTASGVPMNLDPVCMTVTLMVGDNPVRLMVDTGAEEIIFYEERVAPRLTQLKIDSKIDGVTLDGPVHSKRASIPNARLGTMELGRTVILVKAPSGNVLPGIDGYLGAARLKARRIDFNFETNTLGWKK
jgi:predicted aspartyl protease